MHSSHFCLAPSYPRTSVERVDLLLLEHVMWQHPEHAAKVHDWVIDQAMTMTDLGYQNISSLWDRLKTRVRECYKDLRYLEDTIVGTGAWEQHQGALKEVVSLRVVAERLNREAKKHLEPAGGPTAAAERVPSTRRKSTTQQQAMDDFLWLSEEEANIAHDAMHRTSTRGATPGVQQKRIEKLLAEVSAEEAVMRQLLAAVERNWKDPYLSKKEKHLINRDICKLALRKDELMPEDELMLALRKDLP